MNWYRTSQIAPKEPWQQTQKEFLSYHYTGFIPESTYEDYGTKEGVAWHKKEKYPELYSTVNFGGDTIEFRQSGERLRYVKTDAEGDIIRKENGDVVYLSEEEMMTKGVPLKDRTIVAFHGDDAIGWVSDEWGADGVWVIKDYQGRGIGTYLLKEFRKTRKPTSKIGQMTPAGIAMTKSYHKELVKDALMEGKPVSEEVLRDYPDLAQGVSNT